MRKRRFFFILLSLAAVGTLTAGEPVYQGKTLRQWLAGYKPVFVTYTGTHPESFNFSPNPGVDRVVRQIGTNAIPTLLEMLQAHDSPLKLQWIALLKRQHILKPPQEATMLNYQAWWGFKALDPAAAVPALVRIYHENHPDYSQADILTALGHIGPAALPAAMPVLLEGLTNSSAAVRVEAVFAISQFRGQPDLFVPLLISALKDADPAVRERAAWSLGAYGRQAESAVPALVPLLNDPNSSVRSAATNALEQRDLLNALGDIGPAALPAATQILLDELTNSDVVLRLDAVSAIGKIHGQPDVFVPPLIKALKDDIGVRGLAFWSLKKYGPQARAAVPALVSLLNDSNPSVRINAADALAQIDPQAAAPEATKILIDGLAGTNSNLRTQAAIAIAEIHSQPEIFVPLLIEALKDPDRNVRRYTAQALGNYGPDAKSAGPALVTLLDDSYLYARTSAAAALKKINPEAAAAPEATQFLVDGLANTNSSLRAQAAAAIGEIHSQPEIFVPRLIELLKDSKSGVRLGAARALRHYGPDAKPAVPALVILLNDPVPIVRDAATNSLKAIDPAAASAAIK